MIAPQSEVHTIFAEVRSGEGDPESIALATGIAQPLVSRLLQSMANVGEVRFDRDLRAYVPAGTARAIPIRAVRTVVVRAP